MCEREKASLQRGMNYGLGSTHSVILMSRRPNVSYDDHLDQTGSVLVYEGHDQPCWRDGPDPNAVDQPEFTPNGLPTQIMF